MSTRLVVGVVGLIALCSIVCGHDRSSGNPVASTPPPPPVTASNVTITGTVVEIGGGPVEGATIQITPGSGETVSSDESGAFSFTVPANSLANLNFRVSKTGYDTAFAQYPRIGLLKIELQRQRQVTGRVLDAEDVPVADVDVTAPGAQPTKTDANGAFVTTVGRYLGLQKEGFVQRYVLLPPGPNVALGNVRIQRSIWVTGPSHFSFVLSANDPEEAFFADSDDGVSCSPCKWLDVATAGQPLLIDIHTSAPGPFGISYLDEYYSTPARTQVPPGSFDLRLLLPAGTRYMLVGLRTTPGVQVPLNAPVTFDVTVSLPRTP